MKTYLSLATMMAAISVAAFFGIRSFSNPRADAQGAPQSVHPVIVELFTSEGCSSCPPADALLTRLDQQGRLGNAEIIALEEHVDYWDQLGWRDPFSSAQWTQRQQDYAAAFRNDGVYTPQMIVDGRKEFVGSSQSSARSAIADASRAPKAEVALTANPVSPLQAHLKIDVKMLPDPAAKSAQVWLAVTESGLHSNVKHGENAGEDLHHAAVVRSLRKIADAKQGAAIAYAGEEDVPLDSTWQRGNIRLVVFVQDPKSKHILGAAMAHLAQ
ncbi:MAG: DUF1223 domain-containing protein [Acidobacteria bacterium]|nr:DUF1223 domain-containing protein [Acidobacteriota bacterium]MBS1864712.1 DUF1223 domain-containing protein [Acidobacteriota bacterium]